MSGPEADFDNVVDALLALASETERTAYEQVLETGPRQDESSGAYIYDDTLQDLLLARLMKKLREGEWLGSGFGYENGQPTELHPRLWQRLLINVRGNSAYDAFTMVGKPSSTGSFHSLGFRSAERFQASGGQRTRARAIAEIKALFESWDKTLPMKDGKKQFFYKAVEHFGDDIRPNWLKVAWSKADLHPSRRQPGLKSNQSNFS